MTVKTLSVQTLVQRRHLNRCLLDANTAANNDISMGLTTDGSVGIATVPEKLDLAQANTEIVDTLKIKQEIEWTVAERADELGKTFEFECRANKHLSLLTCPRCAQHMMIRFARKGR